jgi:hypothetical protein
MPQQSERQMLIGELEEMLTIQELQNVLSENEDPSSEIGRNMIWEAYVQIQSHRYLEQRGHVSLAPDCLDWLLYELDDKRFKQEIRMSKLNFQNLLAHIANHPIFKNKSNHPQRPVEHQLLVGLKRFGIFGNGAGVGMIARFFRISGKYSFLKILLLNFILLIFFFFRRSCRIIYQQMYCCYPLIGKASSLLAR